MRGYGLPGRGGALTDLLVAGWVVLWVVAGLAVADAVGNLRVLSDALSDSGRAVGESAGLLESLEDVPVAGEEIGEVAAGVRESGAEIAERGRDSRETVERMALLLGLSVAMIPILPALWSYLPGRLARGRERRALRLMVRNRDDVTGLEAFLARRAAQQLSYRRLRRISDEPWRDLEAGRFGALAREELRRMGVSPRALD